MTKYLFTKPVKSGVTGPRLVIFIHITRACGRVGSRLQGYARWFFLFFFNNTYNDVRTFFETDTHYPMPAWRTERRGVWPKKILINKHRPTAITVIDIQSYVQKQRRPYPPPPRLRHATTRPIPICLVLAVHRFFRNENVNFSNNTPYRNK